LKGLVIDDPWISLTLAGQKDWEMRSSGTAYRGEVALIRKGSGRVVGLCTLTDSFGPLDAIAWRAHRSHHRIPEFQDAAIGRWPFAWVLTNVRPFTRPVPYSHPAGAVIWVNLDSSVIEACRVAALPPIASSPSARDPSAQPKPLPDPGAMADPLEAHGVPVASDGSWFSPSLRRSGGFTIGKKGEERKVATYLDALRQLQLMSTAYWRRPNSAGNWGIVAAVRWSRNSELRTE